MATYDLTSSTPSKIQAGDILNNEKKLNKYIKY